MCSAQQQKSEGHCQVCTAANINGDQGLHWPHWPLQAVHERFCTDCPTLEQALCRGRSQQKFGTGISVLRGSGDLLGIKTSLHEQSCVSFCQLYQRLPTQNGHFQGGIRGSSFPETGGWKVPPGGLWQLSIHYT